MKNSKYYPWVVVGLLWFVALLNYLDRQMLSTMKPAIQQSIAELESATSFGRLMAVFLWIYGLMSPVSGIIADRINRKYLIVGSLFVWSAVTLLMGYATTFNQLYWLRAVMGISEALYIPAGLSLIADYHQSSTRSLAVGIHMTGLYMGQALGGFGATIAATFSWQQTFHWFGLIGIVYAVVLLLFLREYRPPIEKQVRPNFFSGIKLVVLLLPFWVIFLYFSIPSIPGWAIKNWLPTLFAGTLHIPMSEAGPLATITTALSSFIGVAIGGPLSDRWVQRNLKGRIYTSAIGLSLTIPALLFLGIGNGTFFLIAAAFCFGVGFGMFDANNMPILCQFVAPANRATAYGLMNMGGVFSGAVVTDFLGKSTDAGHLGRDFALMSLVILAAVAMLLIFLRPQTRDLTTTAPASH
ncbi:Sugar phosphate permease [Chitinophaga jiangningensis]|uniref:Sugar phosphate permease n=1 Tax=Chitinophaga jiangningensis TaxID=1419482 RepID=A0A1M7A936_9BACT|nr:MFS transporter [Chitinophaga jiangningensis]SHL39294.1 Sugar phosphate permease [Chitinophaga jiangningensis]